MPGKTNKSETRSRRCVRAERVREGAASGAVCCDLWCHLQVGHLVFDKYAVKLKSLEETSDLIE